MGDKMNEDRFARGREISIQSTLQGKKGYLPTLCFYWLTDEVNHEPRLLLL